MLETKLMSVICYLFVFFSFFLGEGGGNVDGEEASGQHSNDKHVEDDTEEINPTLVLSGAIRHFLFDPLVLQISLEIQKT